MKVDWEKKFYSFFENLSIIFLSLTLLPFLILSIYVHPSWDDYQFYAVSVDFGIWKAQYFWYATWTGAFFSIALLSIFNPLIYSSMLGYKILPVILIFGFLISCYYLIRELTLRLISKKEILICTLVFCSLYFFNMANVSLGFYWMASSFKYGIPNILMMILFTLMLKFFKEENSKKKLIPRILILILIAATAGSSEVSMVILLATLFSFFSIYYLVNRKINWQLFYFLVVSILASSIVYLSPGNKNRAMDFPNSNQFVNSVINAATDLRFFIPNRVLDTPLLLFTILFIPVCIKLISIKKIDHAFISVNPVYSVISFLVILFAGFFTTYWSLGEGPYDRTMNVVYFVFLIGWFVNVLIIVNYLVKKNEFGFYQLPKYVFIIVCLLIVFSYRKDNNVKLAYKDLVYGTAFRFDEELKNRYKQIYDDKSDTCVVDSIKSPIPKLFWYYEDGSDPQMKYNRYKALYFNKKAYIVKRDSSSNIKNK